MTSTEAQTDAPTDAPTLLSSCARASTREEARFRVDYPNSAARSTRIFALDKQAADAMFQITEQPWQGARFLTVANGDVDPEGTPADALALADSEGAKASLIQELDGADVVVLISGTGEHAGAAEVITREAYRRKIMTAGLALSDPGTGRTADAVVNILRPFASVLVVAQDHEFIPAMLSALRA